MTTHETEYSKQAQDFLEQSNTTIKIEFLKYDIHFAGDKSERDIYEITLKNDKSIYKFNFGQSIHDSEIRVEYPNARHVIKDRSCLKEGYQDSKKRINKGKSVEILTKRYIKRASHGSAKYSEIILPKAPKPYDILACLRVDYSDSLEDFCDNYGYEHDSKTAEKIYNAVLKETNALYRLFTSDQLEQLEEIQ
jgi:hypothetical protein